MIIETGWNIAVSTVVWFFSFIPPIDALDPLAGQMATVFDPLEAALNGLGGWIPWTLAQTLAAAMLLLYLATLLLRVVKSFLPTMSG